MAQHPPAIAAVLTIGVLMSSLSCDRSPTSPPVPPVLGVPAPAPEFARVSGTLWIHDPEGVRPFAGQSLFGWIETARLGVGLRDVTTDSDGTYQFQAPLDSRVRLYLVPPTYQPCAATIEMNGDVTRDVRVVSDRRQLGGGLPEQLLSQAPTLSGIVFEDTPDGRRGVSDVHVGWDSSGGGDFETATTLTDSDGRYVLCGLDRNRSAYVTASKSGYPPAAKAVVLTADATTLDMPLQRR